MKIYDGFIMKILLAGFLDGIRIGRRLKYDSRSKHFHRFQNHTGQRIVKASRGTGHAVDSKE